MRQNIFMGGGPFAGVALGQASDDDVSDAWDAYVRKDSECRILLENLTRWDRGNDALRRKVHACYKEAQRLLAVWRALKDRKAQQTSFSRPSDYQWRAQPAQQNYQWNRTTRASAPATAVTTPTSQPVAAAGSGSDVACYFCANLQGAPTYWMSADQAAQWNSQYGAGCTKVKSKECEDKYGQSRATQVSRQRTTSNLVSQYANPYGSAMTGIRVQNPELLG